MVTLTGLTPPRTFPGRRRGASSGSPPPGRRARRRWRRRAPARRARGRTRSAAPDGPDANGNSPPRRDRARLLVRREHRLGVDEKTVVAALLPLVAGRRDALDDGRGPIRPAEEEAAALLGIRRRGVPVDRLQVAGADGETIHASGFLPEAL